MDYITYITNCQTKLVTHLSRDACYQNPLCLGRCSVHFTMFFIGYCRLRTEELYRGHFLYHYEVTVRLIADQHSTVIAPSLSYSVYMYSKLWRCMRGTSPSCRFSLKITQIDPLFLMPVNFCPWLFCCEFKVLSVKLFSRR